MDNGSQTSLAIERLPQGGYLITDIPWMDGNRLRQMHFACTHMQEALQFIDAKMRPCEGGAQPRKIDK